MGVKIKGVKAIGFGSLSFCCGSFADMAPVETTIWSFVV
jgi:hypothetical protein